MTWSYSGDPTSSPVDAVHFWLGDTDETTPQLSNEEIAYLLTVANGSALKAALAGCLALANKYSSQVDFAVESELRVDLSQRAEAYAKRARELQAQIQNPTLNQLHPVPYTGGISRSDMARQEADTDRVRPSFWVGQHEEVGSRGGEGEEA